MGASKSTSNSSLLIVVVIADGRLRFFVVDFRFEVVVDEEGGAT